MANFNLISIVICTAALGMTQGATALSPTEDSRIEFALKSMAVDSTAYCNRQMGLRYLTSSGAGMESQMASDQEVSDALKEGQLESLLNKISAEDPLLNSSSWGRSLVPTEESRWQLTQKIWFQFFAEKESDQIFNYSTLYNILKNYSCQMVKNKTWFGPVEGGQSVETEDLLRKDIRDNKKLATQYACSEFFGIFGSEQCYDAFAVAERITQTTWDGLTGIEIFERVFSDSRYEKGLAMAALKIGNRMLTHDLENADLFTDIKKAFIESGLSPFWAEEATWSVVGLLATSGANIRYRLDHFTLRPEDVKKSLSLTLIAMALPILDHWSAPQGHIYSFPQTVVGGCNSGKSYHFWFAAYISRRAALETKTVEPAAVAAFQAAKAYQVLNRASTTPGAGTASLPSLGESVVTPTNQVKRIDLAYAAAGSVFGANAAGDRKAHLDLDKIMFTLIAGAGTGSTGPVGFLAQVISGSPTAEYYNQWMTTFNANSAYFQAANMEFINSVNTSYLEFEKGQEGIAVVSDPSCPSLSKNK